MGEDKVLLVWLEMIAAIAPAPARKYINDRLLDAKQLLIDAEAILGGASLVIAVIRGGILDVYYGPDKNDISVTRDTTRSRI